MRRIILALSIATLVGGMPAAAALAQSSGVRGTDAAAATDVTRTEGALEQRARVNSGLGVEMLRLVAEAKAGRAWPASPPQQPARSNGLSRGQKAVLVAGVAAAVIILAIVISRGGDSDRFIAPPCPPGQLCQ